jgi:hypothetical protein
MPQKIHMLIQKGNQNPFFQQQMQKNTLSPQSVAVPKAPSSLTAPFISRIHSVRPGCGSCGRH